MGIIIILVFIIIMFCYYENNVFYITNINIKCNVNEKIRIIHLSDLHSKQFGKDNNRLMKVIISEKPDIIFATGDMIDSSLRNMDKIIDFLVEINKVIPVVYIPGNNEMRTEKIEEILDKLDDGKIIVLNNQIKELYLNKNKVYILGLAEIRQDDGQMFYSKINSKYYYDNYKELFKKLEKKDGTKLVLSHYPENFEAVGEYSYNKYNFDIMFSGHAHGGQFILPFIGGLFAPGQGILPKYYRGVYGEKSKLVVSRGLGNSGFPLRLFNRPDLVVVDIISNNKIK